MNAGRRCTHIRAYFAIIILIRYFVTTGSGVEKKMLIFRIIYLLKFSVYENSARYEIFKYTEQCNY